MQPTRVIETPQRLLPESQGLIFGLLLLFLLLGSSLSAHVDDEVGDHHLVAAKSSSDSMRGEWLGEKLSDSEYIAYVEFEDILAASPKIDEFEIALENLPDSVLFHPSFCKSVRERVDQLDSIDSHGVSTVDNSLPYLSLLRRHFITRYINVNRIVDKDFHVESLYTAQDQMSLYESYFLVEYIIKQLDGLKKVDRDVRLIAHHQNISKIMIERTWARHYANDLINSGYGSIQELIAEDFKIPEFAHPVKEESAQ